MGRSHPDPYNQLVERLYAQNELVIKYDLDAMVRATNALRLPRLARLVVLVGGTNGKGTTSATLHAMLHAAGLRVGLFTSPHLVDFRERIRVGGHPIGRDDVMRVLAPLLDRFGSPSAASEIGRPLSFFELTTLLAAVWFTEHELDVAVLEVGMGGRLDATNTFDPDLSILTSVSLDHMAWLGDTVPEIAREKAAIARAGKPVLAHVRAGGYSEICSALQELGHSPVRVTGGNTSRAWNGALAAAAARRLFQALDVPGVEAARAIRRGRSLVRWPARQQVLTRRGTEWWIDGAHNPASTTECAGWLRRMQDAGQTPATAIVGATPGRNLHETFAPLRDALCACPSVRIVPASAHRSVSPEELRSVLADTLGVRAPVVFERPEDALENTGSGPTLVVGSLYLCGAVLAALGETAESLAVLSTQAKRSASSR